MIGYGKADSVIFISLGQEKSKGMFVRGFGSPNRCEIKGRRRSAGRSQRDRAMCISNEGAFAGHVGGRTHICM